jgi:peptide/nickel transport system permease protein
MGAYVARRILIAIPILFGITIIAFILLASVPGDPVRALIQPEALSHMTPAQIELRRHELGLDGGPFIRYVRWLGLDPLLAPILGTKGVPGILEGEFGYSIRSGQAIVEMVGPRIGPTLLLMGSALLLAVLVGVPLGVIAAIRPYSRVDYAVTTFSMVMISTPAFLLGLIFIYTFAVWLRLFPTGGLFSLGNEFDIGDRIAHVVMPATILGLANAAQLMRYTRAGMLDVLSTEYITTARAKGLPNRVVLIRHGLRNALIPIITVVGILLPDLVAGAIVTEQVFSWPGMGLLAVQAAADRDPSLMMAVVLIVATAVLISNLVADVAYSAVDPRVRFDSAN